MWQVKFKQALTRCGTNSLMAVGVKYGRTIMFTIDHSTQAAILPALRKGLWAAVLFGILTNAKADGGMPLQDTVLYKVPENLTSLSTQEITQVRESHIEDLKKTDANKSEEKKAEEKLFEELMAHDMVRLSIADVIPELIKTYEIEGEFKETLKSYRVTFSDKLMQSREAVENLEDYPSYDFRFAAVYMSMLYSFQKYPEFYDQLKVDMVDETTPIGEYRKRLDTSYLKVKQARAEVDMLKSGSDLKKVIAALDNELARRAQ